VQFPTQNKMKKLLKSVGVLSFIAIKTKYNESVDSNDFYSMVRRRIKYSSPKDLGAFLLNELHFHYKEYAQY
jgi:hypothetical protein